MRNIAAWIALALVAAPATANVKDGVDAWNRKDYAAAIAQWRGPANAGDADAQYNLGQAYRRGLGVPADDKQAIAWYRKAADKGHAQAQASLALLLFQSADRAEAFPWLEKASAQGEARAQYVLATALFNGDGIAKDWPRAYALMRRASIGGLEPATQSLRQMDTYLTPADRQKGDELLKAFANTGGKAQTPAPSAKALSRTAAPTRPASAMSDAKPASRDKAPVTKKDAPAAKKDAPAKTETASKTKPDSDMTKAEPADTQWKVQLGAFGKMDAARAHWKALTKKPALAALKPNFIERGGMVRVQAGPLPNRAAAQRACAAAESAGSACFALQP